MTLSERIAAAAGPDREIDREIIKVLWPHVEVPEGYQLHDPPHWTSDLNVVVGEVERRGWTLSLATTNDGRAYCNVWVNNEDMASGDAHSPCLALLAALVAAVEAKP